MFKLESYITPLLMGYVDKYVKLRPEDFQLSLWGGDAVLNNLDLRLDVIERAIQLPIIFKSGHIHELRIHVPWTKLGSEPVIITINTIECILKLRDTAYDESKSSRSRESRSSPKKPRKQGSDDLPPGYLQSLINKILNNVSIIVNNLILKFVEDDIVLSVNVKSAELFSVDKTWSRAFSELLPPELALRKSINFCDLTVCLDKCDASGKIEHYQDPLIYRCSVTGRIYMKYDSQNAKRASLTKFDLFCEKLDVSLTDLQLPMYLRLIELCLALYYGTMEFPGPPETNKSEASNEESAETSQVSAKEDREQSAEGQDNQGWASWAWSYVPQILPSGEEVGAEEEGVSQRQKREPRTLSIGMYAHKASLIFKLTEKIREKVHYGPHKVLFKPFLLLEGEGIALEILMKGIVFFDVQFGVTSLHLQTQGHCICGEHDEHDERSKTIVKGGANLQDKVTNYYSQSLFDLGCHANQGQPLQFIMDGQQRLQVLTEQAGMDRFGVIYQNYLYVMQESEESHSSHGSNMSSASDQEDSVFLKETSLMRFIIGSCNFNVSSSAVHRIQKMLHCAYNHSYEPYAKTRGENVDDTRPHPTPAQVAAMEENLPTRTQHLTILQPIVTIYFAEHEKCEVDKKSYKTRPKHKGSPRPTEKDKPSGTSLPCILLTASRFDLQVTNPMYPRKLVRFVSKMAGPSSNLLHHCHSHIQTKIFEASAGMMTMDDKGVTSHPVTIIPPFSGALYTRRLLLTMYWKNSHQPKLEKIYELPQGTASLSKPNLLLLMRIISSWKSKKPNIKHLHDDSLITNIFPSAQGPGNSSSPKSQPVLEFSLNGLEMKKCRTLSSNSYTGTLSSLQVILYDGTTELVIPLLTCPADTSQLQSPEFFSNPVPVKEDKIDFITFTCQLPLNQETAEVPCVCLVNIEGCLASLDPALADWFSYIPKPKKTAKENTIQIDPALAQATSPLQKSSRASVESVADKTGSFTRTTSQVDTQTVTQPTSQKLTNQSKEEVSAGEKKEETWRKQITAIFPFIRMMQLQVDIKSSVLFFCDTPLNVKEPSTYIPGNILKAMSVNAMPRTLVVCLPLVHVSSSGLKPMSAIQDIPIENMEGTIAGEKLPWTMQLENFSVYTLAPQDKFLTILKPVSVGCTIAVSSKFSPPASNNISALALCLHTDMRAIEMHLSKSQVLLSLCIASKVISLFEKVMALQKTIFKSKDGATNQVMPPAGVATQPPEVKDTVTNPSFAEGDLLMTETDTSGLTVSRETTPSQDLDPEGFPKDRVRLSLWLQWTLPKFKVTFFQMDRYLEKESKVSLCLEDMTMSVDVQEVYAKIKATCGACNCLHFHRKMDENSREKKAWCVGPFLGKLMSCKKEITDDLKVIMDKHSSTDIPPSPSVPTSKAGESSSREVNHGFMNFTFTRALCKNVTKKMRKLNMEMQLFQEMEGNEVSYDLYFHKYISELCLNVEPCDIVAYIPAVKTVLNCFDIRKKGSKSKSADDILPKQEDKLSTKKNSDNGMSFINSSSIPLLYITVGTMRLFIPTLPRKAEVGQEIKFSGQRHGRDQVTMSTMDNDLMLAIIHSISIDPQADNPLPRYAVEKDLYHRALQLGLTQQPGSAIENRQYQFDLKGMTVCTGFWSDFEEMSREEPATSQAQPAVQIPALEWNRMAKSFREEKSPVQLVQLMSSTDLKIIFAPAIVYTPQIQGQNKVLVCGNSLEVNVINKLDVFLSTNQVLLMKMIFSQSLAILTETSSGKGGEGTQQKPDLVASKSELSHDSGVGSESAVQQQTPSPKTSVASKQDDTSYVVKTPFDILLTANVITCTLYKHSEWEGNIPLNVSKRDLETVPLTESPTAKTEPANKDFQSQSSKIGGKIVPYLHLYFSQPHTVLSCQRDAQKFEMSCYDILMKGSEKDYLKLADNHILPEWSSFSQFWLETRPGQPNHMTGIPPSLYTLRVTDFLTKAASVSLKFERPLKVNLSAEKLQKSLSFLEEIVPKKSQDVKREPKARSSHAKTSSLKQVRDVCSKLKSVKFHTKQMVVAMDTGILHRHAEILGSVEAVELDTHFKQNSEAAAESIALDFSLTSLLLRTGVERKYQSLLSPMQLDVQANVHFIENNDSMFPRATVRLTSGLTTVSFGQEHVMCLQSVLKHLKDAFPKPSKSVLEKKEEGPKTSTTVETPLEPKENGLSIEDQSRDDLRTGKFEYIMNPDAESQYPKSGEIIFCNKDDNNDSSMTWSYVIPRVISLVHFTPIPFNVSTSQNADTDISVLVPCVLQYFEETTEEFMDYIDFELSENSETMLELPELKPHNVRELIVAQTWRVLVKNGLMTDYHENNDKNDVSGMYILPASLAASMRVDSAYIPRLIPTVQFYASMAGLNLKLSNHFQFLGKETPEKLQPFVFDESHPVDQEFAMLVLGSATLVGSSLSGPFARDLVQISSQVALDVVEYKNLTVQNVIRPFSVYGDVSLAKEKQTPMLECNMSAEPMFVKFGRGVVHTLNCSQLVWNQLNLSEEEPKITLSHYFICNDTCHTLRFGQVGTDENLALLPREMHGYSWRTHKSIQSLHVCVDGKVWKWCQPFSIDDTGHVVRVVKSPDQHYSLIIYIKNISNVQKQIIIRGQLVIASRLSHDLEVKVTATTCLSEITDLTYNLRAEEATPSYILEHGDIHCVKVRLREEGAMWSKEIHVAGDKVKDSRMVKITHGNDKSFHIWCRVFSQQMDGAMQTVVLLSPLFVIRSHLPRTLYVNLETPKLKELNYLEVPGQGEEIQLQCLGHDFVHNLSFHLSPTTEKTMTSISLSTGQIDQVEHVKPQKVDVVELLDSWRKGVDDIWPYCYNDQKRTESVNFRPARESSPTDSHRSDSFATCDSGEIFTTQPSLNIHINLTEYWPQCSTLLVDVLPWCLMTNQSSVDLIVIETDGTTWQLPSRKTFTPPKMNAFSIGLMRDANLYRCATIPISQEEVELQRYRPDKGKTLFLDGYVQTRIVLKGNRRLDMCFLTVQSTVKHNIRVISIYETYSVTNMCTHPLMAVVSCIPLSSEKLSIQNKSEMEIPSHAKIKNESDLCPLLIWTVTPGQKINFEEERFINYVSFKQKENAETLQTDRTKPDWSMPARLSANENGVKVTLSMPVMNGEFDTVPLCVTGQERNGLVYYVIREDSSPCFVLYNNTTVPVVYGHQSTSGAGDVTIQEQTELIVDLPTVSPGKNLFYTPATLNKGFAEAVGNKNFPKLMFGFQPHSSNTRDNKTLIWSRALDVNSDMETFLPIPQCLDVKVKVQCISMVTHITIEPISRAEISAKEVRNRIKAKDTTVVIGHTEEQVNSLELHHEEWHEGEHSSERKMFKKKKNDTVQICVGAYFEQICVVLQDEVTSLEATSEVIQICADHLYLSHLPSLGKSAEDVRQHTCYSVCLGNLQVDNQMFYLKGLYDFPVLFIQQREDTDNFPDISRLNVIEKLAVIKSNSFAHVQVVMETDCLNNSVIKSLEISMHPASINIDDKFIYRILKEIEGLIPVSLSYPSRKSSAIVKSLPKSFKITSKTLCSPVRIEQLCIQPVHILLSVHASLKLFLASDRSPLSFGKFEKKHVCTTTDQLVRALTMHYVSGALFRAGIVVGSLEILGNPTGLVRSIGTGVADLVKLPYSGLTKGPGAFVSGISSGMSSFVRNISSGMITSVTNFASSVSRNMDRLSMDDSHLEQQEERRRRHPDGISSGLRQGLTGFGMSLLGAVAGLADQPLQTVMSPQDSKVQQSRLSPATGIVKGVGKGLVGVFTKPIGGAAEFVSQTGQGLLHGTGLAGKQPGPKYSPEVVLISAADNSVVKSQMKMMQSLPNAELLLAVHANFIDLLESEVKVQLLLTNELLIIISVEDDAQQQAFSLAEIEVINVTGDSQLLTFVWKDSHYQEQTCQKHDVNKQRVEAFIDGAIEYVQVSPPDTPPPSDSQSDSSFSPEGRVTMSPKYHFRLEPFTRAFFLELFYLVKNKLSGKGFPVV